MLWNCRKHQEVLKTLVRGVTDTTHLQIPSAHQGTQIRWLSCPGRGVRGKNLQANGSGCFLKTRSLKIYSPSWQTADLQSRYFYLQIRVRSWK